MRLTKATVAKLALRAGKSEAIIFDSELPGFGIRLREGGKRTWIVQYRVGRKQRRLTLGNAEALGADKARVDAKAALGKIWDNRDPQHEKMLSRSQAEKTFGAIVELYLVARKGEVRSRTYSEIERHLMTQWKPLHSRPVHLIDRTEIALVRAKIEKVNGPVAANRARSSLSAMFTWAMGEGLANSNPVIGTNKAKENSRDRVLTDAELVKIWYACRDDDYGRIVRLLILTGQRRQEIGGIAESEIDLPQRMWTLPAERTKNNRTHEVPLSDAALAILKTAPRRDGRAMYFGEGTGPFSGWSSCKEKIDSRIAERIGKALAAWTLHDIRRTVATRMADIGIAPHVIEAVLNHVSGHKGGVAGIYNRSTYRAERRQALDLWAAHIEALAKGKAESNIINLQRA